MAKTNEELYNFANKFSLIVNPMSAAAKYGSLIYGIREAIGDDIDMGKVIAAGAVYTVASFVDYFTRKGTLGLQGEILEEKIGNLEKKIK